MSEMAKAARAANKAKAARMSKGDPKAKVDASSWSPPEMLEADKKTGLRPVSRRAYKRGGKVEGVKAEARADRKARKAGGRTEGTDIANAYTVRDGKEANKEKFGSYHVGGMKRGGKAEKRPGKQYGGTPPMPRPKPKPPAISLGMDEDVTRMPEPSKEYSERQKIRADRMEPDYEPRARGGETDAPSLRLIKTFTHPSGRKAKVYKDKDWGEYRTRLFDENGKLVPNADHHTDDKVDAHDTAQAMLERKRGGKVETWEGSKKDEEQDRKLAKKRGMSMKEWEASEADKKHDKQQSMKGLKRGGHVEGCMCKACGGRTGRATGGKTGDGVYQGTRPTGGRIAKAGGGMIEGLLGGLGAAGLKKYGMKNGGKAKGKGKTNINIVINAGKKDDTAMGMPMPPLPMGGKPPMPPAPPGVPLGAGAAGGMPMPPMPAPGPAGGPPAALMGRKAGGRVYRSYKDMDAGAGSGLGRLEKTEIQKNKR